MNIYFYGHADPREVKLWDVISQITWIPKNNLPKKLSEFGQLKIGSTLLNITQEQFKESISWCIANFLVRENI